MAEAWITCSTGGPRVHLRRARTKQAERRTLCGRIVAGDCGGGRAGKVSCYACRRKASGATPKPTAATLDLQRFAVFEGGHLHEHSRNGKQGDSLFFTPTSRAMCGAPLDAVLADARGVKLCPKCLKKT